MSRLNGLIGVDSVALKRAKEALKALHYLEKKFVDKGYVTGDDIELLRGAQYNLGAAMSLYETFLDAIQEGGGPPLREE
jgi:predicted hydrolase (HD superfamily)